MRVEMVPELENQPVAEMCQRLAHVLTVSKQMLVHGEKDEWERVTELELERRDDLTTCFSEAPNFGDDELVAEAFATLFHLNEELMSKVKIARDEVILRGREITHNRGAVDCYREFETNLNP